MPPNIQFHLAHLLRSMVSKPKLYDKIALAYFVVYKAEVTLGTATPAMPCLPQNALAQALILITHRLRADPLGHPSQP